MIKSLRTKWFYLTILIIILQIHAAAFGQSDKPAAGIISPRIDNDDNMIKILLLYDMEGLAGQNIITSIDFPRPEYFEARKLLTADVNAVIDGLFTGGADSVIVVDAHGSFNPEPDILLDKMDPRAKMLYKEYRFDSYVDLLEGNTFDAVAAVGMHSRTGGGGFAEHTINLGTDWILNGMHLNESEIFAYSWGRIGVPIIFVSGDDKLAEQLSWMTWLEYVTVKEARGIDDALLYPVDEVHKEMKDAAKRSVENLDNMKAATLREPITATLHVVPPADLSILEDLPGITYENQSVTFQAEDFAAAYTGMRTLMSLGQTGYFNIAAGMIFENQELLGEFKNRIFDSWREYTKESEEKPVEDNSPKAKKLYFGSQ